MIKSYRPGLRAWWRRPSSCCLPLHVAGWQGSGCIRGIACNGCSAKFRLLTDGKTPMIASASSAAKPDQIDALSRAAIREEIGDRLRISLPAEFGRLPQNMIMLIEQMACAQSPGSPINRKTEILQ